MPLTWAAIAPGRQAGKWQAPSALWSSGLAICHPMPPKCSHYPQLSQVPVPAVPRLRLATGKVLSFYSQTWKCNAAPTTKSTVRGAKRTKMEHETQRNPRAGVGFQMLPQSRAQTASCQQQISGEVEEVRV